MWLSTDCGISHGMCNLDENVFQWVELKRPHWNILRDEGRIDMETAAEAILSSLALMERKDTEP